MEILEYADIYSTERAEDYASQIFALLSSERQKLIDEVGVIAIKLGETQIELYGGKLPFTFFGDKTDEEKKIMSYRQGIQDFYKQVLSLL